MLLVYGPSLLFFLGIITVLDVFQLVFLRQSPFFCLFRKGLRVAYLYRDIEAHTEKTAWVLL